MSVMTMIDGVEVSPEEYRKWRSRRRAAALEPRTETLAQRKERLAVERAQRLRQNWEDDTNGHADLR